MQTSEFVKLLQNELILQRDPHIADRFAALLDEHFEERPPQEPQEPESATSADCAIPIGARKGPDPGFDLNNLFTSHAFAESATADPVGSEPVAEGSQPSEEPSVPDPTQAASPAPTTSSADAAPDPASTSETSASTAEAGSSDQQPTESAAS